MKTKENKIKELWKRVRTNFIVAVIFTAVMVSVTMASATPNLVANE